MRLTSILRSMDQGILVGVLLGSLLGMWGATKLLGQAQMDNHPAHECRYIQCADVMSTSSSCGGGWCVLGAGHQWYKCMPDPDYSCNEDIGYGASITCNGVCLIGGGICSHGPYGRCAEGGN